MKKSEESRQRSISCQRVNAPVTVNASLSTVGVARTTNLAFRRLQLSVAARVGVSGISSLALRNPFSLAPLRRSLPKSPLLSLQTESRLRAQLATVLRGSSEDSHESLLLLSARGRLCEDSASSVED